MIKIRKAAIKDSSVIVDFQLAMAKETEDLALDRNLVEAGVGNVFEHPEKGIYYVAEQSGIIIASLLVTPEWSDWRNGTVLWIQSVYVTPGFRGKGVYPKMYAHLQEIVRQDDAIKGLRLYVDCRNTNAQKVYRRLGMDDSHYTLFEWMK